MTDIVADLALKALLYEVAATPKPGLVDRCNNGAHRDMDFYTFVDSAIALRPHFALIAAMGYDFPGQAEELFSAVRPLGIEAEKAMLKATGGVNTHKGALFSLGLVCAAAGRLLRQGERVSARGLSRTVAEMTRGLVLRELAGAEPLPAQTKGMEMYRRHGARGARGQAEEGYRMVAEEALPFMRGMAAEGLNTAHVKTLLFIASRELDTNILSRAGADTAGWARAKCAEVLLRYTPLAVQELDSIFIEKNISPGGAADLLSVTIFFDLLEREFNFSRLPPA